MAKGIEDSAYFLILLTKEYEDKVNLTTGKANENCNLEFTFASTKRRGKMIIIVLDERMLEQTKWTGKFGLNCSQLLYIDGLRLSVKEAAQEVLKILKKDVRFFHFM